MTTAIAFVLVLLWLLIPLTAARSAVSFPRSSWRAIGRSHKRWLTALAMIPFGIAWFAAAGYLVLVRPRLKAETAPFLLAPGKRVRFHSATGAATATLVRPTSILGMPAWLLAFELADGTMSQWRFVTVALEPLEPGV